MQNQRTVAPAVTAGQLPKALPSVQHSMLLSHHLNSPYSSTEIPREAEGISHRSGSSYDTLGQHGETHLQYLWVSLSDSAE